jgi:hypothetical protein
MISTPIAFLGTTITVGVFLTVIMFWLGVFPEHRGETLGCSLSNRTDYRRRNCGFLFLG